MIDNRKSAKTTLKEPHTPPTSIPGLRSRVDLIEMVIGVGGGLIYVLYKTQTAAGTLSVASGTKGTGNYMGTDGSAGITSTIDITP